MSLLTETELLQKLRTGEDSFTQYKSDVKHTDSLAEEMVGIAEDETGRGKVVGVQNLKNLNNHISKASSENTVPAIIAKTESLVIDDKVVVVIQVEEAIANALVHRNYDKAGSVRIFVFQNRVEIISPGAMPNHLTIEQVKNGNAIPKNPILLGYAIKLMPYRGTGSGIRRMIEEHPNTELINDREGQQFKVIFWR